MKNMIMGITLAILALVLAACGEDEFSLSEETALTNAEIFLNQTVSFSDIQEVVEVVAYTTNDGAQAYIFEVRLGSGTSSAAKTDYVKVWKNAANSPVQANWSDETEFNEKQDA